MDLKDKLQLLLNRFCFKGVSVLNQAPVVQEAEIMAGWTVFRGNANLQGSDQSSRH